MTCRAWLLAVYAASRGEDMYPTRSSPVGDNRRHFQLSLRAADCRLE